MNLLTREDFLLQVFNYEESQDWQYQGTIPCLIDFHDDLCAPCLAIAPVLTELEEYYKGRVKFYKVAAPEQKLLVRELGVVNFPTLVLCPLGDKPVVLQGAAKKEKIQSTIEKELLGDRH